MIHRGELDSQQLVNFNKYATQIAVRVQSNFSGHVILKNSLISEHCKMNNNARLLLLLKSAMIPVALLRLTEQVKTNRYH